MRGKWMRLLPSLRSIDAYPGESPVGWGSGHRERPVGPERHTPGNGWNTRTRFLPFE